MSYDFGGRQPALEPGSLILVTGVTGFIGGHVADSFIQAGYNVRGTSRNASRAQWTVDYFNKQYGKGRYEVVEISDMDNAEAYVEALKGVSGVAHVASDLSMDPDPNKIIPPMIIKIRAILTAAANTPSVKRFVLTSSSTALTNPKPGEKIKITLDTWNEEAVKEAWAPPPYTSERGFIVYGASKKQGEEEAWKFVKENKPQFVFNAVLPNANFGRLLDQSQSHSTSDWPRSIYETGSLDEVKATQPQWYVDVEDTARLHVAAMIDPDVKNERIVAFAEPFNWSHISGILRHLYPAKKFPADIPDEPQDLMSIPNERAAELLRNFGLAGFTPLEQSIKNTIGT